MYTRFLARMYGAADDACSGAMKTVAGVSCTSARSVGDGEVGFGCFDAHAAVSLSCVGECGVAVSLQEGQQVVARAGCGSRDFAYVSSESACEGFSGVLRVESLAEDAVYWSRVRSLRVRALRGRAERLSSRREVAAVLREPCSHFSEPSIERGGDATGCLPPEIAHRKTERVGSPYPPRYRGVSADFAALVMTASGRTRASPSASDGAVVRGCVHQRLAVA